MTEIKIDVKKIKIIKGSSAFQEEVVVQPEVRDDQSRSAKKRNQKAKEE